MRLGRRGAVVAILLAGGLVAGCGSRGGTTSEGGFQVIFTDERLQTVSGNRCAVRGSASNLGNLRARVTIAYQALSGTGAVIGTSSASFEVAGFSNFDFTTGDFSNGLACSGISNFRRSQTDISRA